MLGFEVLIESAHEDKKRQIRREELTIQLLENLVAMTGDRAGAERVLAAVDELCPSSPTAPTTAAAGQTARD